MVVFTNEIDRVVSVNVERLGQFEFRPGVWAQGVTIIIEETDNELAATLTNDEAQALLGQLRAVL